MQIGATDSDISLTGPISVSQGSILSCLLFSIFTLDLPEMHHNLNHSPMEYVNCQQAVSTTFVDDLTIVVKQQKGTSLQEQFNKYFKSAQEYLQSNKLCQNDEKTKFMVLTTNKNLCKSIKLETKDKKGKSVTLKQMNNIRILGVAFSSDRKWDHHVNKCKKAVVK